MFPWRPSSGGTSARRRGAGFTLLELLIAMTVFAILGTSAVVMMRQGATLFVAGTRENEISDRQDTLLPEIAADLTRLALPDSSAPPVPVPTPEELGGGAPPPPPPPVLERLRAGVVLLTEAADPSLRSQPCPFVTFVLTTGDEAHDPRLRRAGDLVPVGETAKPFVKSEVDKSGRDTIFRPTGGRMEVLWIAVPRNKDFPAIQTLYRGYRAPVGGAGSLLEPSNFNTLAKIEAACDLRHEGLLHFSATWRRATATGWTPSLGRGDDVAYVGPLWDSTRALNRDFPLFRDALSLSDPSDDLFPRYVRLEATLAPPGLGGYGKGDTRLVEPVSGDEVQLALESVDPLLGPGPRLRYLKLGGEWLSYDVGRVDAGRRVVAVERAQRGTTKAAHEGGADVYVGQSASADLLLPVFRDFTMHAAPTQPRRAGGR